MIYSKICDSLFFPCLCLLALLMINNEVLLEGVPISPSVFRVFMVDACSTINFVSSKVLALHRRQSYQIST